MWSLYRQNYDDAWLCSCLGDQIFTLMHVLLKSSHMKLDILGEGGNYFLITASCSEMEINPL